MNTPPRNILIVRLSAIGDVVHTLPCLTALRRAFPEARIGWMVEELSATLLQGHPLIDELIVVPKKRWRARPIAAILSGEKPRFYSRLRKGDWDVAIDFQGLTKSGLPLWLSGARMRIGFGDQDGRELNKLFTNVRVTPPPEARHVIERNLALLAPLGIHTEPHEVDWTFPDFEAEREELGGFFQELGAECCIALYPGAGWETKRWPAERFGALARLLADADACPQTAGLPLVLVWGPGEEALCRDIIETAGLPQERLRMAPPTNLRQLAALLGRSALVIGGDTGPVHLAAALARPVVGIYGGSEPIRNGPWGAKSRWLLAAEAPCKVCWRTTCNYGERLVCLHSIEPEVVAGEACSLLKAEPAATGTCEARPEGN